MPQEHLLTARQTIYWTDLRGETVLLSHYDPGRDLEDLLVSKLVLPEDRPRIERHDVSRGIIKSLISMTAGISLVLESETGPILPAWSTETRAMAQAQAGSTFRPTGGRIMKARPWMPS